MTGAGATGEQHELVAGEHRAVVTEVGATLRRYTCAGRDVIDGFSAVERSTYGRGQVLAPWPNRLRDGRYSFGGADHQLPINEPARGNAIHGLVRWQRWAATDRGPDRVTLTHTVHPRDGYPFLLELALTYALEATTGLTVALAARSAGDGPCPFGIGFHPYLATGGGGRGAVDQLVVRCPAATRLVTDERAIPVGSEDVAGTEADFRAAHAVGATVLDTCFTDLVRGGEGRGEVEVIRPDGAAATVWMDEAFGFVMLFSADTLPGDRCRAALAVEPMSCAPDAFRSGRGLVVLEPGRPWRGTWGIRPGGGPV